MKKNNQKNKTSLTRKIFSSFKKIKTIFKKDTKEIKDFLKPFSKLNKNLENIKTQFPKFSKTPVFKNIVEYVDKIDHKIQSINKKIDGLNEKLSQDDEEFLKNIDPSLHYLQNLSNRWVEYLALKKDKINLIEKNITNISTKATKANEDLLEKIKPSVDHYKEIVKTLSEQIDKSEINKIKKVFDKWKLKIKKK